MDWLQLRIKLCFVVCRNYRHVYVCICRYVYDHMDFYLNELAAAVHQIMPRRMQKLQLCIYIYIYMYIYIYIYIYIYVGMYMLICIFILKDWLQLRIKLCFIVCRNYMCIYVYICVQVCMCICVCIYVYIYEFIR